MDSAHTLSHPAKVKKGLRRKLILSMLLVGALPLVIGLSMAFLQGTKEIREVSGESFEALATEIARKVDLVISDEIASTSKMTTDVDIIRVLEDRRDGIATHNQETLNALIEQETQAWTENQPELVTRITQGNLVSILRRYYGGTYVDPGHPVPVVTRSATRGIFITDVAGRLVASLDTNVSYTHAHEPWWQGSFNNGVGQPYIGNVAFDERLSRYTFTLSLPIMDSIRYQAIGVLHRIYDAKEFFAPSIDTIRFGKTGHVMLIDSDGFVLSCPILSTGTRISDHDLIPLVTPMHTGWTQAPSDGHGGQRTSIIGFAPLPNTSRITQASTGKGWHMFVWQSSEELFAPIDKLFTWISVFGLLAVGLLITLGYIASGRIVNPIRRLQEAARLIGRGEWQKPVTINTGDEIEELAEEVNRMNQQLASVFAGLETEVELKTQEVQFLQESTAQILDSVPDPVIMLDEHQQIQYLNRASKETFHLNHNGQVEGTPLFSILNMDQATQNKLTKEFQSIGMGDGERRDESDTNRSGSAATLRDPLHHRSDTDSATDRREIHFNDRTYRYDWFTVTARPGHAPGIGLVLRDTTEESRLQEQLIQGEKLASLGVLSAGIGHELNNPLVGVIGLGEAIQEEQSPSQIKEYAQNIVQHGRRMASIIKDFTGQAAGQLKGQLTQVNVNEQLDHTLKTVRQSFESSSLEIQTSYQPLPFIKGNPHELGQALINIITNAVQAMRGKGKLDITTTTQDKDIKITIRDNGPGISRAHLSKIFDPFFTTKQQGEGGGLGLTIARRIIQKHGGQIQIDSQEGQGTTCQITLPLTNYHSSSGKEEPS